MSITITYSTMDHRYFMRRTKSEIIARIGDLRGNHVRIREGHPAYLIGDFDLKALAQAIIKGTAV